MSEKIRTKNLDLAASMLLKADTSCGLDSASSRFLSPST
jgi:hypothetical protein